jgi:K+-transporting ATPase KdpF subunit
MALTMDYIVSFLTAVALFAYLLYALVRPERF